MKRVASALCAALFLMGMAPAPALVVRVLDQSNNPVAGYSLGASADLAQTFTVGKTGQLAWVDLYLGMNGTHTVAVKIEGLTAESGMPNGTVATHGSASVSGTKWQQFTLEKAISVAPGDKYAIIFNTTGDGSVSCSPNSYRRGQALFNNGAWETAAAAGSNCGDYAFETILTDVVTPTPTPAAKTTLTPPPLPTPKATTKPAVTASSGASGPATSESPSASAPVASPFPGAASPVSTASAVASEPAASASPAAPERSRALTANSTSGGTSGSGSSQLPIVAAIIVVLALAGAGLWFLVLRRRRPADSPSLGSTEGGSAPTAPAS